MSWPATNDDKGRGQGHSLAVLRFECALAGGGGGGLAGPLLGCGVEEVVTPQLLHHLVLSDTELRTRWACFSARSSYSCAVVLF